jgi:ankyrin repeat protein
MTQKSLFVTCLLSLLVIAGLAGCSTASNPALHSTIASGDTNAAIRLIEAGTDVFEENAAGQQAIQIAAADGHTEIVHSLLSHDADVNATNRSGWTPLHQASWSEHEEVAELLLQYGARLDAQTHNGLTPLMLAAEKAHRPLVDLLLSHGASLANEHQSVLHNAALSGDPDIVKYLITKGASVNARNSKGGTPLYDAANAGHYEVAKLLLEEGAAVDPETHPAFTPLVAASTSIEALQNAQQPYDGHWKLIGLLYENGARLRILNEYPYDTAIVHRVVADYLRASGGDVERALEAYRVAEEAYQEASDLHFEQAKTPSSVTAQNWGFFALAVLAATLNPGAVYPVGRANVDEAAQEVHRRLADNAARWSEYCAAQIDELVS